MADNPLPRPLLRRADFVRLAHEGASASAVSLIVQGAPNRDPGTSVFLGFTVSSRVGKAVVRNRVKRRLREAARAVLPMAARAGTSYVVIGKTAARTRPFDEIKADLRKAIDDLHRKLK